MTRRTLCVSSLARPLWLRLDGKGTEGTRMFKRIVFMREDSRETDLCCSDCNAYFAGSDRTRGRWPSTIKSFRRIAGKGRGLNIKPLRWIGKRTKSWFVA
jgi:hypothetical protein